MTSKTSYNPTNTVSRAWLIPAGLLLLSVIPMLAGTARLADLTTGAEITPENARFFDSPAPVVIHIISATIYSILGAFQFAPGFRRQRRQWHRNAGRLLIPLGLATALTGLWMSHFYAWPEGDGEILYGLRLLFGFVMTFSILMGVAAIRQKKYARHGDWMMRAYAIGLGAGTQVLTHLPWFVLIGTPGEFPRAILMGAGWVINLMVAEWVIRQRQTRPDRRASPAVSLQQ